MTAPGGNTAALDDKGPVGLGGFLLVIPAALAIVILLEAWSLTGAPQTFAALKYLNNDQTSLVLFYMFGGFLLGIAGPLLILGQFFFRSRAFPSAFISLIVLWLIYGFIIATSERNLSGEYSDYYNAGRAVAVRFAGIIFIPYLLRSKRVKNTFVK